MKFRRKSKDQGPPVSIETGTVTIVPPSAASGGESVADDKVLSELSEVFADASGDPAARHTISIGGDDELPDALYLDDELGRDDSGSEPVFIDDDGSTDAVLPKDATSRGIEPRLRQRRIGVRRAASRKRLWWLAAGIGALVVAVAALAVLGSSWFAVETVTVTGNVYT
ncbi:MAG: hypothetical protein WBP59_16090, partial [Ilumatobacteraceae bacterium]